VRSLLRLGLAAAFWTVFIGLIFDPASGAPWEGVQTYSLAMGGVGLLFAIFAAPESRDLVYGRESLGPLRLPRGVLATGYALIAIAGFAAFTYLPLESYLEGIASLAGRPRTGTVALQAG